MKVALIAALARNRVIGAGNRLPWHLPEDLKRFRKITSGCPVIMGRKTFESIGRLLPHRLNIIVTRNPEFRIDGAVVVNSLERAIAEARSAGTGAEIFVIGGADIYEQALPFADRLYLTIIDRDFDGDAKFPKWDPSEFREIARESGSGELPHSYVTLERIS